MKAKRGMPLCVRSMEGLGVGFKDAWAFCGALTNTSPVLAICVGGVLLRLEPEAYLSFLLAAMREFPNFLRCEDEALGRVGFKAAADNKEVAKEICQLRAERHWAGL